MPNGHGIPLGCFVCTQYQKDEPNPLFGYCTHHEIKVDMDIACADFDNAVNDATHPDLLNKGLLYAFVDVMGQGYPPPLEFVPLAKIADYKAWDDDARKQAWTDAQQQANEKYRRIKP